MGTEIFVVMQGEYSDRRAIGMFSTRELAEKCVVACSPVEDIPGDSCNIPDIEVFPLDLLADPLSNGYRSYEVKMRSDGGVGEVTTPACPIETGQFDVWSRSDSPDEWQIDWAGFARSEEHAIKICNDLRAYIIASWGWKQFTYTGSHLTDLDGNPVEEEG